jgi:signal transduction histidine kinase
MLKQPGKYDTALIKEIDSGTVLALENKTVDAYNELNQKVYHYQESIADSLQVTKESLNASRNMHVIFSSAGKNDQLFYYDKNQDIVIVVGGYDARGKENLRRLIIVLLLTLVGGLLIAFTSGYFFSKILLRPIKKIADEVHSISAKNLAHRIKSGNAIDEWNYLTETLNDLLNRLQESFEVQRRFVSSVSHELNTPLTSISSQLDVSLQRERNADDYKAIISSVYQDVRQLSKLTQTLLEFATLSGSSGGIELNLVRIDEVLARLPAEMIKLEKGYSVKFTFTRLPEDETNMLVFGNEALLFTAIKNIVSNACKYSQNKLARIELTIEENDIIISVTDDGKGIPEHELQNIFQPFYRTEDSRSIIGFGIGLPLVSRIIKLHKGQITVRSVVNKGTSFFIQLPIAGKDHDI